MLLAYSLATMVLLMTIGGQPRSAQESFAMLTSGRLLAVLRLDGLSLLAMPMYYLIFWSLFGVYHKQHLPWIGGILLLGCAGVTLFLATPSVFSWLALHERYASAASESQRTMFLAAGEALLASDMWHASGAVVGGWLIQTAALLVSVLMLRAGGLSRLTAWVGIVTHGLDLLHLALALVSPQAGAALMFVAGPLYLVLFPLLARDLFRLANHSIR